MPSNELTPILSSRIAYKNRRAAVDWLEKAFGFKTIMLATDGNGDVVHAEMKLGNGRIHIGSEWENIKAPSSVGDANTQTMNIHVKSGIDEHCERARAAAKIIQKPEDQFYGDRTYRATDPEGHMWIISQRARTVPAAEMEAAVPGMKIVKFR